MGMQRFLEENNLNFTTTMMPLLREGGVLDTYYSLPIDNDYFKNFNGSIRKPDQAELTKR